MILRQLYRKNCNYSICYYFTRNIKEICMKSQLKDEAQISRARYNFTPSYRARPFSFLDVIRKYSKKELSADGNFEREFESVEHYEEQEEVDVDEGKFQVKKLLYPTADDALLDELNNCTSTDQVLEIYTNRRKEYGPQHMVQTVLVIWNFCKDVEAAQFTSLINSPVFNEFLIEYNNFIELMNPDEITCSFLYLSKIGIDSSHLTIRNLILKARDFICSDNSDVPLTALSRFSVGMHGRDDIHTILNCKEIMPHVMKHLEFCTAADELRLITICMHNLVLMVSEDMLNIYNNKVTELIDLGIINKDTINCILKLLNFLNYPHWSQKNSFLIRRLMLILEDQIENFSLKELEIIFRVFHSQKEPALFVPKLLKAVETHCKGVPDLEMFSYVVQFSQTHKRDELIKMAKKYLLEYNNEKDDYDFSVFFRIIRALKISDTDVCNKFWDGVLKEILENSKERENFRLVKHCHRYMHFNNNLGGTYRHKEFEKVLSKIVMTELTEGITSIIPSKFARLSSFVLAYGRTENSNVKFPDIIVEKIEAMADQFNIIDCLFLSRGLQIATELRFKKHVPPTLAAQLIRIESVLNACTERRMKSDLNSAEINFIVRSFNNRKISKKTPLYEKAIDKYRNIKDELNSRLIRDITFNLNAAHYLIPEIFDKIWDYLLKNRDYIMGDTVEKILNCSYNLGYIPTVDDGFHWSAEIIKRDFDYMSGLAIIQSCLALCFYKAVPESLTTKIFCIDFIKRLEDEIHACYSKATYPEKVLNKVMQLNRAVCLDYPEYQVPWFQQNYIEAQMSKKPIIETRYHTDVKSLLLSLVGNEKFLKCNHITPYGYIVDFVIHFDKNKKPIPPPIERTLLDKITKVAILPLRNDSFCENSQKSIRGHEHLRMRHLEILGYKVIHINLSEWNAMYMNVPGAKMNYLKNLLQIE